MIIILICHLLIPITAVDYHLDHHRLTLILTKTTIHIQNITQIDHVNPTILVNGLSFLLVHITSHPLFSSSSSSDYDPYPPYRNDSYGISSNNQPARRHQPSADIRSPDGFYPPQDRSQHPPYQAAGSSNYPSYYGMHQR